MSGPSEIYLDARVAKTMPQEPDDTGAYAGAEQLRYFSFDRVQELLRSTSGSPEFVIQLMPHPSLPEVLIVGLTNYGRLHYFEIESQTWGDAIDGPVTLEAAP